MIHKYLPDAVTMCVWQHDVIAHAAPRHNALCAALTVYVMTKAGIPVSTTQAIVGAIVGWNLFSGSVTDLAVLSKIASTWIAAPVRPTAWASSER